ncbi:leucyl/phenylalanyl-tRNA--protein transferase [Pedobacter flavus]|uniref:Leucyl/phenylalanyl-tRNA--protein transferase n=1 Tax=Pedobacter flavus TaxID=3113906 RepID=A0ABU7H0H7_9SPHI|nr:leucyl/phenylalanyl-tRNA--protein transferase [Pedobacter sp. VNH31]MEE1884582.1 leucyl/phenylalanyl-tRNA--protein transferase [Pedobacter sp. VNH31]
MVFLLNDDLEFPDPSLADDDGLLAIGGDLTADRLIKAYSLGIFPWFSEDEPILWFCPPERCVIFPEKIKISKSMKTIINSKKWAVTVNKAFNEVIVACSKVPRKDQDGTWITDDMINAYKNLNQLGKALSIEVWENDVLIGGLYGVISNSVFCGESMFSKKSNASKMALIYLCKQLNFKLIDCQIPNDHLISMGAEIINYNEFKKFLDA